MIYCTILSNTIQYHSILYYTIVYCTILSYATLCYAVLYNTALYCEVLHCTAPAMQCTVLYCSVLYCTVCPALHSIALRCTMLYAYSARQQAWAVHTYMHTSGICFRKHCTLYACCSRLVPMLTCVTSKETGVCICWLGLNTCLIMLLRTCCRCCWSTRLTSVWSMPRKKPYSTSL